ncbi:MAG: carbamoyltransferase HypF [Oscillospiraceae bacterium]|nr:carbamoyltransferase HypF [Oscillospiraceae bacterium]
MAEQQGEVCYKITIQGIVQGVGFRPFVYREAKKFGIRGTVKNVAGEVRISAAADSFLDFTDFIETIKKNKPAGSFIESIAIEPIELFTANDFIIVESMESENPQSELSFFSPDLALCDNCRAEIFDDNNIRRKRHYFNNCPVCGPRFSALKAFPYDRVNTSMNVFPMCDDCSTEYKTPDNIRFHAETICCNHCGPELFYKRADNIYRGSEAFDEAVKDLHNGDIVAIKGIGGYHLACSPYDAETVRRLRLLKGREKKPFAVMFRDTSDISKICEITPEEETLLISPARPIILLKMKNNPFAREVLNEADGRCGCFLPYTPLQALLLAEIPCLIMTSANRSSSPIIKDESAIFEFSNGNINVLYHNREIVRTIEDSVLQVVSHKLRFIRRARGYTPLPVFLENTGGHSSSLLCAGSDLKSAFGLLKNNVFTLSQYIGDLENAEVFGQYEGEISDFENLFAIQPEAVICDAHPRYFSSEFAKKFAYERNLPLVKVFHHHAHIASVMAEHRLSKVLGVAFDGSGYGEDGNIWGGEFLLCEEDNCRRLGHLKYAKILGSDSASEDAAKTAMCYLYGLGITPDMSIIKSALDHNINTFLTSSMGRLFDAVASVLGICQINGCESECAVRLQYAAEYEAKYGVTPVNMSFTSTANIGNGTHIWDYSDIFQKCLAKPQGAALGFHIAVCDMIEQMCIQMRGEENIQDVALSGGVFQNAFLLEMVIKRLAALGFSVFTNEKVPPNDGGLALGQAYIGIRRYGV